MHSYQKQNLSSGQILTAACLNYMDEGIFNNSTFYKELHDGDYIILENNTEYIATEDLTTLTFSVSDVIDATFRCSLDFGCGDSATAFTYPEIIVWSGDSLDINKNFVPIRNHRYHIDIWYDGAYIRGNASGVIV